MLVYPSCNNSQYSANLFFIYFLPCTFLVHIFWLPKNDIFRTVSEPMMIIALDTYYIILNITILFWIQINFYADNTFLEFLCLPNHLVSNEMIWQTGINRWIGRGWEKGKGRGVRRNCICPGRCCSAWTLNRHSGECCLGCQCYRRLACLQCGMSLYGSQLSP